MKEVTFGQYYPSASVMHKMNAAVKILLIIAYMVAVFMVDYFHFLGFFACLFLSFKEMKSIKILSWKKKNCCLQRKLQSLNFY